MAQQTFPIKENVPITLGEFSSIMGNDENMIISYKNHSIIGNDDGFNLNSNLVVNGNVDVVGNISYIDQQQLATSDNLLNIGAGNQINGGAENVGILNQVQYADPSDLGPPSHTSTLKNYPLVEPVVKNRIYLTDVSNISSGDMVNLSNLLSGQSAFTLPLSKVRAVGADYVDLFQAFSVPTSASVADVDINAQTITLYFQNVGFAISPGALLTVSDGTNEYSFSLGAHEGGSSLTQSYANPGYYTSGLSISVTSAVMHTPGININSPPVATFYEAEYNGFYFNRDNDRFEFNRVTEENNGDLTVQERLDIAAGGAEFVKEATLADDSVISLIQTSTNVDSTIVSMSQTNAEGTFMRIQGSTANSIVANQYVGNIVSGSELYNPDMIVSPPIGYVKIEVSDANGQVLDGDYYMPFYTLTQNLG